MGLLDKIKEVVSGNNEKRCYLLKSIQMKHHSFLKSMTKKN